MLKEEVNKFPLKHFFIALTTIGLGLITYAMISTYNQTHLPFTEIPQDTPEVVSNLDEFNDLGNMPDNLSADTLLYYSDRPGIGDSFGTMEIPALDRTLPLIEGTEEKQLSIGVGHVITSVLPGEPDNSVLAGHRSTTFRDIGTLVIGDLIIIHTNFGLFTYQVSGTRIVEDDDETVIVSTPQALLTLITCYPFDAIGSAPQRYIITAELIESVLNS